MSGAVSGSFWIGVNDIFSEGIWVGPQYGETLYDNFMVLKLRQQSQMATETTQSDTFSSYSLYSKQNTQILKKTILDASILKYS